MIDGEGMCNLEEYQFITDVDLKLAMIEHRLKQVAMGIVLWVLHIELVSSSYPCLHDLPKRHKINTTAENEIEEIHCIDLGLLLLLLTQLLYTDLGHTGLSARMEGLTQVHLHFFSAAEKLIDELALMIAI